jgi:hypothetical protein
VVDYTPRSAIRAPSGRLEPRPCGDGRWKPNVCVRRQSLYSAKRAPRPATSTLGGTSMRRAGVEPRGAAVRPLFVPALQPLGVSATLMAAASPRTTR